MRLLNAAANGKLNLVKDLVSKGADVNHQDDYGWTALMIAAWNRHLDIVKYLVKEGKANVNIENKYGYTALMKAARNGYLDIVEYLVKAGANVDQQDQYGDTASTLAARKNHLNIVKILADDPWGPPLEEEWGITIPKDAKPNDILYYDFNDKDYIYKVKKEDKPGSTVTIFSKTRRGGVLYEDLEEKVGDQYGNLPPPSLSDQMSNAPPGTDVGVWGVVSKKNGNSEFGLIRGKKVHLHWDQGKRKFYYNK